MESGYLYVRVQLAVPGYSGYGVAGAATSEATQRMRPVGTPSSPVFEPSLYVNNTIRMFDYLRAKIGFDVELIHDAFTSGSCQIRPASFAAKPSSPIVPFTWKTASLQRT